MSQTCINLDHLHHHPCARVCGFAASQDAVVIKLREIGFAEGDEAGVLARGCWGERWFWCACRSIP